MTGVVVGNEVLDAMPVELLHFDGATWHERGVVRAEGGGVRLGRSADDALRPPLDDGVRRRQHDRAACAGASLRRDPRRPASTRGAAFLIDYGFPEAEYYHPQRTGGTLMCHRGHRADTDPLVDVGLKDITAHVDFTGIAVAGAGRRARRRSATRRRRAS